MKQIARNYVYAYLAGIDKDIEEAGRTCLTRMRAMPFSLIVKKGRVSNHMIRLKHEDNETDGTL